MGSDNGFNSFLEKEKKLQERLKKGLPKLIISKEEMQEWGINTRIDAENQSDYTDESEAKIHCMLRDEEEDGCEEIQERWKEYGFDDPYAPKPIKLFNEYPQGNPTEQDSDIHHKNDYMRELNRKANVAFNLYFELYELIKKNYPENYENGAIEADKIIAATAHFVTAVLRDIVESGVYHADDALSVFYSYLAQNYDYLVEHSKNEKDIKLYGALKTIRLRRA